jgi:hypothetical protein
MHGILLRWLFAFALLIASYNPTPWNYAVWVQGNYAAQTSLSVLLGLLLLVGYIIYLRATIRSIGWFGMALIAAIVASLIWVLHDWGILDLGSDDLRIWLGLASASVVLGVGLSWSIVRRALSGQADVDDVDE